MVSIKSNNGIVKNEKLIINQTSFSQNENRIFPKFVKKIKSFFSFDLSDPVDGWLSFAILFFGAAILIGVINWAVGGVYILGLVTTILAILGLGSFVVWIFKALG